jgi:hypothetical protein
MKKIIARQTIRRKLFLLSKQGKRYMEVKYLNDKNALHKEEKLMLLNYVYLSRGISYSLNNVYFEKHITKNKWMVLEKPVRWPILFRINI